MSKEEVDRFAADVKGNGEMQEQVKNLGSDAAGIVSLANEKGYDFTEEELRAYAEEKKGELSDEQLKKVAGGAALAAVHVGVVG